MKQLQNNYTSQEQSEKLLELGLPADSADLVFMRGYSSYGEGEDVVPFYKTGSIISFFKDHEWEDGIDFIPCWSVGRLIEIYEIVGENAGQCLSTDKNKSRVERLVQLYEENVTMLDFLKLEE